MDVKGETEKMSYAEFCSLANQYVERLFAAWWSDVVCIRFSGH
jgi:hypothetical protein